MATTTEYLDSICEQLGIDTSTLPDRLLSTYLSSINQKLGLMVTEGTLNEFLESFTAQFENGKQQAYKEFADNYQDNGTRTDFKYSYAGRGWTEKTFKPNHNMQPINASYMFASMNHNDSGSKLNLAAILNALGVSVDFSKATNVGYCFYQAMISTLGTIDLSSITSTDGITSVFNSTHIITVENLIPPPIVMANTCFQNGLVNLGIGGEITKDMNLSRCVNLSGVSVQNVLDHLADLTGQTTQTITFAASVGAKLTENQKAIITAKNWTLAY